MSEPETTSPAPALWGVLAELRSPAALVSAARRVREAGYVDWDAHSPFPVHGIEGAIGIRMTRLPLLVLLAGVGGLVAALVMQWWMNAVDYPLIISGKPLFSLPANIPVIFELTVLFAGVITFLGVLVLNVLPQHHHPLFSLPRFRRVTRDGFFLSIAATDPAFALDATTALLRDSGATAVEPCFEAPASERRLPRAVVYGLTVAVALSFVPLALIARARSSTSPVPALVLFDDMGVQPKARTQAASTFFANGRAYREPVLGVVSQEDTTADQHLWQGKLDGAFATTLPPSISPTGALMRRGQERFGIYCGPCHGLAGGGDGPVARRAEALKEGTWVPPTPLFADHVRAQPLGRIVYTMANGIRTMPAYGSQLPAEDRWAIAVYVRALQRSHATSISDVPAEIQPTLK